MQFDCKPTPPFLIAKRKIMSRMVVHCSDIGQMQTKIYCRIYLQQYMTLLDVLLVDRLARGLKPRAHDKGSTGEKEARTLLHPPWGLSNVSGIITAIVV